MSAKHATGNAAIPLSRPDPLWAASSPDYSAWVNASAGTGKTNILTRRALNLLLHGTLPHRILCLTYTKAAAAEMAERIRAELGRWVTLPHAQLMARIAELTPEERIDDAMITRARKLFAECLDVPDGLKIQTLHGFCQSVLQRFPLEAGLMPHFEIADERLAQSLLHQATIETLQHLDADIADAAQKVSVQFASGEMGDVLRKILQRRDALERAINRHGDLETMLAEAARLLNVPQGWNEQAAIASACDLAKAEQDNLRRAAQVLIDGSGPEQERGGAILDWLSAAPQERARTFADYAVIFLTQTGEIRKKLCNKNSEASLPGLEAMLQNEAARIFNVRQMARRASLLDFSRAALTLAQAVLRRYESVKARALTLDYDDLIARTLLLLQKPGIAPWILFKLDGGIDHLLIDEAQDTSFDQWQIVRLLTEEFFSGTGLKQEKSTLFAVGDPKQSIFSFQRADPRGFGAAQNFFRDALFQIREELQIVPLFESYRSTAEVLRVVDSVFANPTAQRGVLYFSAAEAHKQVHTGFELRHVAKRGIAPGLVEIWPAALNDEAAALRPWFIPNRSQRAAEAAAKLARALAGRIRHMLDRGEMLAENPYTKRKARPIQPGDIMILLRRRDRALVPALTLELKKLHIPVAGIDRLVLSQHIAVMDLLALAKFLLLPEDNLNLAALLKSPLVPLDNAEDFLFDLCHNRGEKSLWQRLCEKGGAAHDYLAALYAKVDRVKPFELFHEVLGRLGGRKAMLARFGAECLDPIEEFLNLCLAFGQHTQSLQQLADWMERDETEIKRDMAQGNSGEVRILTVHASKGLQAPVVFLPDTASLPRNDARTPDLLEDEERGIILCPPSMDSIDGYAEELHEGAASRGEDEYRRLLYVALTRAEDRLYIAAYKEPQERSWYNLIAEAAGQMEAERVSFDFAAYGVPGWRGEGWRIGKEPAAGGQAASNDKTAPLPGLPRWAVEDAPPEPIPTRPLMPSAASAMDPPAASPLQSERNYLQRGRIVHRLLQTLPDLPPERRGAAMRQFLAQKIFALSAEQQAQMAADIARILDHPDYADYFSPASRAEVPITGRVGAQIISGRIDRLAIFPDRVKILDFKTGRPPAQVPEAYRAQMAHYKAVLQRIYPNSAIETALLWTGGPVLVKL